jgi:hypothetical protein
MKTTLLFLSVFLSVSLFGQNVYIPDANFKAYLVGNPYINTNGDTEIQVSEASAFDGSIWCAGLNITDLTGIEAFTAFKSLYCYSNQLTVLDLSQNTALVTLECWDNQLTTLNVNGANALKTIHCYENLLTSIDLSQNIELRYLSCNSNPLTSLDVSQNILLIGLGCSYTQITSLDLSQNSNLVSYIYVTHNPQLICLNVANGSNSLIGSFEAHQNSSLYCIQVDDVAYSTANMTVIDPQASFSENCDYPSSCFTSSLTELTTSKNLIQILDMMGRETTFKPNTPLIYVYDDGTTEKVFTIE